MNRPDLLDLSDRILAGTARVEDHHPFGIDTVAAQVGDGVLAVRSFANVAAFTTGDGLVLVDTGSPFTGPDIHRAIRRTWSRPVHTAVYTHGHIDHVFGTPVFDAEAAEQGWPAPQVVAHEDVEPRFDRYCLTAGYNAVVNRRQFGVPGLEWPTDYRRPDRSYRDRLVIDVGDVSFELHHARGETDDHTWVWVPSRRALCTGDLIIWCTPNAGNPQKVQRYARDWSTALRAMAELGAELLLPGHGLPVRGAERVRTMLVDTADLLDSLHDQTVALMNQGAPLDEVLHTVSAPAHLLERPYLRPIYDEPEFIVRNVWRLYGGWYDGNPANLKPAPEAAVAAELADLAGGATRLAERARNLLGGSRPTDLRLAGHLVELAARAAPDDPTVHAARADVYDARADAESSLMARGLFRAAANDARAGAGGSVGSD